MHDKLYESFKSFIMIVSNLYFKQADYGKTK
jgi:hypothetical protein